MRGCKTRLIATLVLVAALLAPFASGWAMALGVADGRLMVICSGDGLRTIYIDENGDAKTLSDEAIGCVLKAAADTAKAPMLAHRVDRLLFIAKVGSTSDIVQDGHPYLAQRPRAPPVT